MHGDIKLLRAFVVGEGTPGLVKQVAELESFRNRIVGAVSILSVLVGAIVYRALSMVQFK